MHKQTKTAAFDKLKKVSFSSFLKPFHEISLNFVDQETSVFRNRGRREFLKKKKKKFLLEFCY